MSNLVFFSFLRPPNPHSAILFAVWPHLVPMVTKKTLDELSNLQKVACFFNRQLLL